MFHVKQMRCCPWQQRPSLPHESQGLSRCKGRVPSAGIADRKSTMPMLANGLLRVQGKNQLLVAATNSTSR
jgi:hypothetical protein